MPKHYGVKEKDQVVALILDQMLAGSLRSGDRIDRGQIVAELGLSRVPVQEAMIQLERDGIVSTRYHRGAFIERFDAETVTEHHEVDGLLSGVASARAAASPTPQLLSTLTSLLEALRAATESRAFQETLSEFRRAINHEYAGPRLRAAIRASQSFIPPSFWMTYDDNHVTMMPFYELEHAAIHRRDPLAARTACSDRSARMAEISVADLISRGVFDNDAAPQRTAANGARGTGDRRALT